MITDLFLTDVSGEFALDTKTVNLEWLVVSDSLFDFAVNIAIEGTVSGSNMLVNNKAAGWLALGKPYKLGSDSWDKCFSESVHISDRRVITGKGNYEINVGGGTIIVSSPSPSGIVLWKASQKFSTKADEEKDGSTGEGGTSTSDKFTMKTGTEFEEVPFFRDIRTGKLILNSAKQFFNPMPTVKRKIRTYSLTRRERGNPVAKCNTYSNVVNSDNFYGAAPGTVLMESITCDYDGSAWQVTYNMKERADKWETYILDTGYEELDGNGKLKKILDSDGTPVSEPAKLNGSGHKLTNSDETGYDLGPFWKYPQLSFNSLNIPNFYTV